jgi:acyl-CoA thioesterase YciA
VKKSEKKNIPNTEPCPAMPAIRVMMMPKDVNARGTIFGGVILSQIDQAGAVEALRQGADRPVTILMKEVHFHHPVHVGDIVSYYAETLHIGRTSISVKVTVEAERRHPHPQRDIVTTAEVIFVNVDERMRPIPIRKPVRRRSS